MLKSKNKVSPYEKCIYFNKEKTSCGPFKRWNKDGIFQVNELTADITNHLHALKLLPTNQWNEKTLIESRLQAYLSRYDSLCAYHRFSFGNGWKQPNSCQHPRHEFQIGKKGPKIRSIPLNTLAAYNEKNLSLPVGAVFCFSHLKSVSTGNNIDMLEPAPTPIKSCFPADDIYVPDITIISDETIEESKKAASSLCEAFGSSPLSFQIMQKQTEDLKRGAKQVVKTKFEKIKMQLKEVFAQTIASGQ